MNQMPQQRPCIPRQRRLLHRCFGWRHDKALGQAWKDQDEAGLLQAIARGANPDLHVSDGKDSVEPILAAAARTGQLACVQALIEAGADLESRGPSLYAATPLGAALFARQWKIARELALAGARWDAPVCVVDAKSWSYASAISGGGIDPRLLKIIDTTLENLVLGEDLRLRDATVSVPLASEPGLHALLKELRAGDHQAHLKNVLGEAEMDLPRKPARL